MENLINKVHNVDCLEFMKKLPDKCIDLIVTDPPYGMCFLSSFRKETTKHKAIQNDDNLEWLDEFIEGISRITKDNGHIYIFCSMHHIDKFVEIIKKNLPYKNILIWEKNNTGMGDLEGDYAPKYEFIIFCSNGQKKLRNGRDSNILKFSKTGNEFHPTQKPVALFSYLIEKSSEKGDLIFDGFGGSGTTAIASIQTGRNYILCEKEKKYCDIAQKRIENTTLPLFTF